MIRVIIERRIKPGAHTELERLLIERRTEAMKYKGYISGETLQSTTDLNHVIIISSWHNEEDWRAWYNSPERQEMDGKIRELLIEPEKVSMFEFVHTLGSTPPHFSLMA